jgi:two-component system, OmpR family, response regulator MprA
MSHSGTILVVDDDSDSRESLKVLLEVDGHRAITASGADEALSAIAAHKPVCVILDLLMPRVDGAELARRIRSAHGNEIVLLALTGSTRPSDQASAEQSGVDYVFHKPFDVERLRRLVAVT